LAYLSNRDLIIKKRALNQPLKSPDLLVNVKKAILESKNKNKITPNSLTTKLHGFVIIYIKDVLRKIENMDRVL
jgi:hypothetical protein